MRTWSWEGATVWGIWKGLEEWGGDIIQMHWMLVWDSQIINKINAYLKTHFICREKWRGISFIPGSGRYVHIFRPQILYFFLSFSFFDTALNSADLGFTSYFCVSPHCVPSAVRISFNVLPIDSFLLSPLHPDFRIETPFLQKFSTISV